MILDDINIFLFQRSFSTTNFQTKFGFTRIIIIILINFFISHGEHTVKRRTVISSTNARENLPNAKYFTTDHNQSTTGTGKKSKHFIWNEMRASSPPYLQLICFQQPKLFKSMLRTEMRERFQKFRTLMKFGVKINEVFALKLMVKLAQKQKRNTRFTARVRSCLKTMSRMKERSIRWIF